MPKEPPVLRFMLHHPIGGAELGPHLAYLAGQGITDVHYEIIEDIKLYKQKQVHEIASVDFLEPWTVDNPTFRTRDVAKYFEENGRGGGGANYAIRQLVEKGVLRKLAQDGHYARADVKALAAPKKIAAPKKKSKTVERIFHEVNHRDFILRYARSHGGRITRNKLISYFEQHDRKGTSVGGALNMLMQRKQIKQLGEGEYILLTKGGAKPKPAATKPPAKINDTPAITEAEHG